MKISICDEDWEYWLNSKTTWSLIEATCILVNIIPSARNINNRKTALMPSWPLVDKSQEKRPAPFFEGDMEMIYNNLKKDFKTEELAPKDCLQWAIEHDISLGAEVKEFYRKLGCLSNNPEMEKVSNKAGKHWGEGRAKILALAFGILNNPTERVKFIKEDGSFNLDQLSYEITRYEDELAYQKGGSISRHTIRRTLKNAADALKKQKSAI